VGLGFRKGREVGVGKGRDLALSQNSENRGGLLQNSQWGAEQLGHAGVRERDRRSVKRGEESNRGSF
jgi:hypothetical protein